MSVAPIPEEKHDPKQRRSRKSHKRVVPMGPWFVAIGFVFLVIIFGGATRLWTEALALIGVGSLLMIWAPRRSPGAWIDVGAVGLLVALLLTLVPFGAPDVSWRALLGDQLGLELGSAASPQPLVTLESLVLLTGALGFFYFMCGLELNYESRRRMLLIFVAVSGILAAFAVFFTVRGIRSPFAPDPQVFSYLPNKNQTATLFAMAGVAAVALAGELFKRHKKPHYIAAFSAMACAFALLAGKSRAGLLLFLAVGALWFLAFTWEKELRARLKYGLPLLCLALVVLMAIGGDTVGRTIETFRQAPTDKSEFRLAIYGDTFGMIGEQPLRGVGAGNFEYVFPQYRDRAETFQGIRHPESDWLWLFSELGLPGLLAALVGLAGVGVALFAHAKTREDAYKRVAGFAVLVFLLHSLVDVPGHRFGTVFAVIFLFALARREHHSKPLPIQPWLPRAVGGLLVLVGVGWMVAFHFKVPWHSEILRTHTSEQVETLLSEGYIEEAVELADRALEKMPLAWRHHYERGRAHIARRDLRQAALDFRRARAIETNNAQLAFAEGVAWMAVDPARTIYAWRHVVERETRLQGELYKEMIGRAKANPVVFSQLEPLSELDAQLRYQYLLGLPPERMAELFEEDLRDGWIVEEVSAEELQRLLDRWVSSGDTDRMMAAFENHPQWSEAFWWEYARLLDRVGRHEEACEMLMTRLPVPVFPKLDQSAGSGAWREAFEKNPQDVLKGINLLGAYKREGKTAEVLQLLETLTTYPDAPAYLFYWLAEIHHERGRYDACYGAMVAYRRVRERN